MSTPNVRPTVGDEEIIVISDEEGVVVQKALDVQARILDKLGRTEEAEEVRKRLPNTVKNLNEKGLNL